MLKLSIPLAIIGLGLVVLSFVFAPAPTTQTEAAKNGDVTLAATGKALFDAKGCSSCHFHSAVPGSGRVGIGPNLSNYRADAAYLKSWLANPKAVRSTATMPTLDLSSQEISAIVAFLTNPTAT